MCCGAFSTVANAAANRIEFYFSRQSSLLSIPAEYQNKTVPTVNVGETAYLWAYVQGTSTRWTNISIAFNGPTCTNGLMYDPATGDTWRRWNVGDDKDPVGDNYIHMVGVPVDPVTGLGDSSADTLEAEPNTRHFLLGAMVFGTGGAIHMAVGAGFIIKEGTLNPPIDDIYFGFSEPAPGATEHILKANGDLAYGADVGATTSAPDLYIVENNDCSDAIAVTDGTTVYGSLVAATNDGSATCGSSATNPDVWYEFTAPCNGVLHVNTCGTHDAPGQDLGMDTVLSVHSGCPGTSSNQLICSDDWSSGSDPTACTGADAGALRDSAIALAVTEGQTVYIRVSHFGTAIRDGLFVLHVDFTQVNDRCAGAVAVTAGAHDFCTIGATPDGYAIDCVSAGNNDIWYRYTAAARGALTVSLCDSSYDTKVAVYDGWACPPTSTLACNDDVCGFQSEVTLHAISGHPYLIRVAGFSTWTGTGTMRISLWPIGDMNCDGRVDFDDINPFVAALVGRTGYQAAYPWCTWLNGDIDGNSSVDFDDINPFVSCLVNGGCP